MWNRDLKDRVFAIQKLSDKQYDILLNYLTDVKSIFQKMSEHIIHHDSNFRDIVVYSSETLKRQRLPSWISDWFLNLDHVLFYAPSEDLPPFRASLLPKARRAFSARRPAVDPLVLRPAELEHSFTIIGQVYIHGLINGEAMGMVNQGELSWQRVEIT